MTGSLQDYLDGQAAAIAAACTTCGKCHEICPVVPFTETAGQTPETVAGSVVRFLAEGTPLSSAAQQWADSCNGCGDCIPACPEAVNPRQMLILALTKGAKSRNLAPQLFRKMSRAIKVAMGMLVLPQEFSRLIVPPQPRRVPVVFYVGCNALRTPNLLFNTMVVLDALDIDYEVVGGPSSCCGVIHTKWQGELEKGERVTRNTLDRFGDFEPQKVLNWCPTCHLHLTESLATFQATSFDINHVTDFINERVDALRAKFVRPIHKRVVLHAHAGYRSVGENVASLISAIPGVTLVETVYESGYTCGGSGCNRAPGLAAVEHAHLLDRVRETGADVLVTLYHGCHAAFAGSEADGKHRVLNFTDLLVEALGEAPNHDQNKHYRLQQDLEMIITEAQPYLRANGLEFSDEWLRRWLPEIFVLQEFKGGLGCFASPPAGDKAAGDPAAE